ISRSVLTGSRPSSVWLCCMTIAAGCTSKLPTRLPNSRYAACTISPRAISPLYAANISCAGYAVRTSWSRHCMPKARSNKMGKAAPSGFSKNGAEHRHHVIAKPIQPAPGFHIGAMHCPGTGDVRFLPVPNGLSQLLVVKQDVVFEVQFKAAAVHVG